MSAIGILGGAFDPPHDGHLALARGGIRFFSLDRLLVWVVAAPGHKDVHTSAEARLELARISFETVPEAEVSLDRHPRTVDALAAAAEGGLRDPVFLVGADEFASFLDWTDPEGVLRQARLGVAMRPGVPARALEDVRSSLSEPERVTFFPIEQHLGSSSEIRRRVAAGKPIDGLVPPGAAEAIVRLGLYREE